MTRHVATGRETRKALGAYYTPPGLVQAALAHLPWPRGPIADLACGDGAWLEAAARRWPGAALEGVDIDPEAVAAAQTRLGGLATIQAGDGARVRGPFACVIGNPPWGAGRVGNVRRGIESASAFVDAAVGSLAPGGRLCLLLPAAWLEVAAHAAARRRLAAAAAIERLEHLGDVFAGVHAPAALLIARREPDAAARAAQVVETPHGPVPQAQLLADPDCVLNARLDPTERALVDKLEAERERLAGRVRFILGVVTGDNRRALDGEGRERTDAGEPIVTGTDVAPMRIAPPSRRLVMPLEHVQQAAARATYARDKVVYRFVSSHPVAAVDRAGRLTLNSANAFAADDPEIDLDFVAAWLNSSTVRWVHRARHAMPRVLRSHLERLPLPSATPAARRAIAAAALDGDATRRDTLVMDAYRLDGDERRLVSRWPRS
ncbi:MAG: type restriction-modification system methyltransferase subunit [Myxococcales bacterium]|nr:type restriction-modification system methyltransferase subunit [Myxococcales bacterium]